MKESTIATVALQAFYDKERSVENILQQLSLAAEQGAEFVVTLAFNVENVRWQFAQAEVVDRLGTAGGSARRLGGTACCTGNAADCGPRFPPQTGRFTVRNAYVRTSYPVSYRGGPADACRTKDPAGQRC